MSSICLVAFGCNDTCIRLDMSTDTCVILLTQFEDTNGVALL
jgi:hypothetical protein